MKSIEETRLSRRIVSYLVEGSDQNQHVVAWKVMLECNQSKSPYIEKLIRTTGKSFDELRGHAISNMMQLVNYIRERGLELERKERLNTEDKEYIERLLQDVSSWIGDEFKDDLFLPR